MVERGQSAVMVDPSPIVEPLEQNLTRYEWSGLVNRHNLADGHARQNQSRAQEAVVARLGEIFCASEADDQVGIQREFEHAFYDFAGQPSVAARDDRPLHHYSASVSTEVVGNWLRQARLRVGLLHPTFDNIAAILQRQLVPLRPISERIFSAPDDPVFTRGCDAVFLVLPNNPTGVDPSPEVLRAIADGCRARDQVLILDASFRFFSDRLRSWDQYAYFDEIGLRYIGIEDTGKTWPTLDLKVGSLVVDARLRPPLQRITDDFVLNVSPFIFRLLREYIATEDTLPWCVKVGQRNRAVLEEALAETPVTVVAAQAPMSVAWLELPDRWRGSHACAWLSDRGVAVLPGAPFFWDDTRLGESHLRVALMRPEDEFVAGADALRHALGVYESEAL